MRGGDYKCSIFKMHLKLRDQQLKAIIYIYDCCKKNLMVTTNQKSIIDIHTKKKKESKHNTKDSPHQITREQKKKKGKKRTYKKQTQNSLQNGNKNIHIDN